MKGLGRIPHPDTPAAAAAYPISRRADYRASTLTHRYWFEGEVWLDQGEDGTCVGNAFGHRYADGPSRHGAIDEAWARQLYLDASGDATYQQGTSGLAACRIMKARGEISAYHWITSPEELRNTVLELGSVCVGTDWYNSMFDPITQYNNSYLTVDAQSGVAGGHEYVLNGIAELPAEGPPFYRMKNSWGQSWGHVGTARIVMTDLERLLFNHAGDAVLITEV